MLPQLQLPLASVHARIVDFLRREIENAGSSHAVVGLSGGIDSALSAYLTAEAVGADNLLCVMMPYKTSSAESLKHARLVVDALGVRSEVVDITPLVEAVQATDSVMNRVRLGNIMARQRMVVLYDRSAREDALVVGTGNKTEILLGYTTLFGDSACAINPVGDLYKTQVWAMAEHLGIPEPIIRKKPSADLWIGQTDEDELGVPYLTADEILYFLVDEKKPLHEILAMGYELETVERLKARMERNAFKRTPVPIARLAR